MEDRRKSSSSSYRLLYKYQYLLPYFEGAISLTLTNILPIYFCQCTDIPISTEMFVNVIKMTSHIEELDAIRSLVCKQMTNLRSQDSGGREEGTEVKQQINSLDFLRRIIDARINRLDNGQDTDSMGEGAFSYQEVGGRS